MIGTLKPEELYSADDDLVRDLYRAVDKLLDYLHAVGEDTSSNEACIDAIVIFLSNSDAAFEFLERKAGANRQTFWDRDGDTALRAMAIVGLERYIDDGGWEGP